MITEQLKHFTVSFLRFDLTFIDWYKYEREAQCPAHLLLGSYLNDANN